MLSYKFLKDIFAKKMSFIGVPGLRGTTKEAAVAASSTKKAALVPSPNTPKLCFGDWTKV
ncbi:hypothetical protein A3D62_03065 [Candidatus Kaiserbacteria bacterium RIFCSPHIGHO2_02_FULL_49_11]|uniref:Uncharacterized protein n=1 Tax=Candidatus Kaiserbacteria bacterium RIFCSPHIGHO2_02_FULL_49_11 TaxID=1798489 RepID=A0A1F6D0Q4_9BACT|nr:MAG: hypothetical protein A3D62_03065 [Candidatus Kaiserbacteria bacterium RIFCSPHIGHO2_02_FULL_49_11]